LQLILGQKEAGWVDSVPGNAGFDYEETADNERPGLDSGLQVDGNSLEISLDGH